MQRIKIVIISENKAYINVRNYNKKEIQNSQIYYLNLFCFFRFQHIYHEQFVGLLLHKKVISQSRLLRNRNANYNKKVSSTSVESSLYTGQPIFDPTIKHTTNPLSRTMSTWGNQRFLEQGSPRREQSNFVTCCIRTKPLDAIGVLTGCYEDRALPLYIDSNDCMKQ